MLNYVDIERSSLCAQPCKGVDVRAFCSVSLNEAVTHAQSSV